MKNPFDFNNNGKLDLVDFLVASELDPNNPLNMIPNDAEDTDSEIIDKHDRCIEDNNEEYHASFYDEYDSSEEDYDYGMELALNDTGADADIFDMDSGDYENWLDSLDK